MMIQAKKLTVTVFVGLWMVSSACRPIDEIRARFGLGGTHHQPLPKQMDREMKSAAEPEKAMSAGELAKANSELLSEMMKVVFNEKEIDDRSNFGTLVHTLNEGASLEGIYRGLVMGSRYRGIEAKSKAASPETLKVFAYEMAQIQSDMKSPTEFTKDARKAPSIEYPDGIADTPAELPDSQEVKPKLDQKQVRENLIHLFIGASPYTLKRVLAEEAMKKMDEVKDSTGEMAQWYAKTTLRLISTHVDFGLAQRNLADFDFHFKFAQNMAEDRVRWEVLNRYHRLMNAVMNSGVIRVSDYFLNSGV